MKLPFHNYRRTARLSARGLATLSLCIAAAFADTTPAAGQSSSSSSLDYSSFRLIPDRNIFNSRRYARVAGQPVRRQTTRRTSSARTDAFALVGTMSYYKGPFAFFEGTSTDYRKAAKPEDVIGGLKVIDIQPNHVKLLGTNIVPEWALAAATNHIAATNLVAVTNLVAGTNLVATINAVAGTNQVEISGLHAATNAVAETNLTVAPHLPAATNLLAGTNLPAEAVASVTDAAPPAEEPAHTNTNLVAVPYTIELAVGMQVRRDEEGVWKLAGAAEHYTVGAGTSPLFGRTPDRPEPGVAPAPAANGGGEAPTVIVIDPTSQEATMVDSGAPEAGAPAAPGDAAPAAPSPATGGGDADAVLRRLMERAAAERGDSR